MGDFVAIVIAVALTVFAYFGTLLSLYLMYAFSWTITAIAEIIYFRHTYRKQMALEPAAT